MMPDDHNGRARLHRVLYCSRISISPTADGAGGQIATILASARANNARDGLTGALLYSAGCFAQVLEGRLDRIERTFERIQRDRRHQDVKMVSFEAVDSREFKEWSMAYAYAPGQLAPEAGAAFDDAFNGGTEGSGRLVTLMRGIIARQDASLAPRPSAPVPAPPTSKVRLETLQTMSVS